MTAWLLLRVARGRTHHLVYVLEAREVDVFVSSRIQRSDDLQSKAVTPEDAIELLATEARHPSLFVNVCSQARLGLVIIHPKREAPNSSLPTETEIEVASSHLRIEPVLIQCGAPDTDRSWRRHLVAPTGVRASPPQGLSRGLRTSPSHARLPRPPGSCSTVVGEGL